MASSLLSLLSPNDLAPIDWLLLTIIIPVLLFFYLRWSSSGTKLPPGPFAWPLIGSILSIRQPLHAHFAKLSLKYGPLIYIRLGSMKLLVANNAEMAKKVLKAHDAEFANRPRSRLFQIFSMGFQDMVMNDYGEHWRKLRRISSTELFSPAKLRTAHSSWESSIRSLVGPIQGETVDVGSFVGSCTTKLMCDTLFGADTIEKKKTDEVFDTIQGAVKLASNLNLGEVFPAVDFLDLHGIYRYMTNTFLPKITSVFREIINDRRLKHRMGDKSSSILDTLLLLQDDNTLSDDTVMCFLLDMISAGTETSHTFLEWAMAELLANPEMLRKAQQEVDDVVGRRRLVKVSDLNNMPYIQAIVKENLRLHSIAPLGLPHFNHKPVVIRGYTVPARCQVLVNIWAISRDPARWPEAEVFKPERFIEKDINLTGQDFDFIPFSAGRRICAGYPMALSSTTFILATLIHAFNWEAQGEVDLREATGTITIAPASKLIATAHPRLDEAAV